MAESFKIAAAYIRVSTEDQTEYSPDAQLAEIRKFASSHHYLIPAHYIYIDEGISGKKISNRGAFNQMIGMAKQKPKPFDAIILWKFSRFARNREDSIVYKSLLRKQLGIEVLSVSEPVGDDKMSILIEALIEAMDEYYSINLAEEVKRGMTEKARRGELQSTPPFGFRVQQNQLIPVEGESLLVATIFDHFIAGDDYAAIAAWLNTMGIKTHRGNRFEIRTVAYILQNPAYIGKLRWNPSGKTQRNFDDENIILSDSEHPALISQEVWSAAQKRVTELRSHRKSRSRPALQSVDWLSGLVRCSACDHVLVFSKPCYWKCGGYTHGTCSVSQHISDEHLKDMILTRMAYDLLPHPVDSIAINQKTTTYNDKTILLHHQKELLSHLERMKRAYLSGIEPLEQYAEFKTLVGEQLKTIQTQLHSIEEPDHFFHQMRSNLSYLSCVDLLKSDHFSSEEKKSIAGSIIDSCIFSKERHQISIVYRISVP